MSRKKPEIYQTFLASLKGGVYPQFGKTPNYFRFFLVKASLRANGFGKDLGQAEHISWIIGGLVFLG